MSSKEIKSINNSLVWMAKKREEAIAYAKKERSEGEASEIGKIYLQSRSFWWKNGKYFFAQLSKFIRERGERDGCKKRWLRRRKRRKRISFHNSLKEGFRLSRKQVSKKNVKHITHNGKANQISFISLLKQPTAAAGSYNISLQAFQ
jgi:hypothetical protein